MSENWLVSFIAAIVYGLAGSWVLRWLFNW